MKNNETTSSIRGSCAWNFVKSPGKGQTYKKVVVFVIRVAKIKGFLAWPGSLGDVVQVVKKRFSDADFKACIPMWVHNVFESSPKGN